MNEDLWEELNYEEKDIIQENVAGVAMVFLTIIINAERRELSHKELINHLISQCHEFIKGTDMELKYPNGFPIGFPDNDDY